MIITLLLLVMGASTITPVSAAPVTFTEGADLGTGYTPNLTLDIGVNTFSGVLEMTGGSPQNGTDTWTVTLPANQKITRIQYSRGGLGGGGVIITFAFDSCMSYSPTTTGASLDQVVNFTSASSYCVSVRSDFNSANTNWTVIITVETTFVGSPPVITVPGPQTGSVGVPFTLGGANAISIADAEGSNQTVQVSGWYGTTTLSGTAGLSFTTGDGTDDMEMTFSGTLAAINTALNGLTFTPTAEYDAGTVYLDVYCTDADGNNDYDSVTITLIAAPNQPPVNTTPVVVQVTNEDTALTFSGANVISIADPDAGSAVVQVALTVTNGILTLDGTTGLTITAGANGSAAVTVQGTMADINAALDGMVYTPTANYHGGAILQIITNDLGNTGTGGALTDTNSVTITVNSVNDAPVVTVPGTQTTNYNTPITLSGATAVSVADIDGDNQTVTLTAADGTMTLSGVAGLSFTTGDGTADANMVFSGTLAAINTALNGLTFTPTTNFFGSTDIDVSSDDGNGGSDSGTVVIDVIGPPNQPPVNTVPVGQSTDEDTALTLSGANAISIADPDAGGASVQVVLSVTNGTLTLSGVTGLSFTTGDGTADATMTFTGTMVNINAALDGLSYMPTGNYNGGATLQIVTNDQGNTGSGGAQTDTDTVAITVNAVNDAPVAVADSYTATEDTPLTVNAVLGVLANDTDVEGSALTAALDTDVTSGTLALNTDGSFTYTPNANFNGSDSFTYHANDGTVDGNIATVTITVNAVNDAPVAVVDSYTATEDTPLTVNAVLGVLANDSDVDGNPLTTVLDTDVTSGTLALNADGSFTYTPNANFNGSDSFTYHANDGTVSSNVVTVTITVNAVNDAPVAVADSYTATEDTPLTVNAVLGVLANDTDVEGSALTAALDTDVTNGTLALSADGSFTYTPNANFSGSDSFTYHANDGTVDGNVATVTITVNAVNDAPVAVDDAYNTPEDTPLTVNATLGVLANDSDVDGNPLTTVLDTSTTNGTLALNADGSFTYTPNANFNGSDSFTYHNNDGTVSSNVVTVTITVNAVNDAPVAVADSYTATEDTPLTVNAVLGVLDNDTDAEGDPLIALANSPPANGGLGFNLDGSFTYTPNANFNGSDSFTYRANDGTEDGNIVTVTITVNAVNDAPVAVDDAYNTPEDTPLTVNAALGVLANDNDVDGNPLTAVLDTSTTNGTLTFNADGSFTYSPNATFNGDDSFTYHNNDGTTDSPASATVTITVNAVNDPPVAVADSYTATEDIPLTVGALPGVLANDTDVDSASLTAVLDANPTNGTLALSTDGSFTYTPNANFNGSDSFTYHANDGAADGNIVTVTITVAAVNDAPTAVADSYTATEDTPLTVNAVLGVLANDTDAEGDSFTAALDTSTANGTLTFNADGSFTYTPNANFSGSDSFTYHASDGTADGNVATVTITVNAVNDAPVAVADSYNTPEDIPLTVGALPGVLANDTDIDTDPLTAALDTDVTNGTLILNTDGSFTYTPNANFNGGDSFTYHNNDGTVDSNIVTVTITVNAVNDAPVAVADSYTATEDTPLTVNAVLGVLANDTDVEGTALTAALDTSTTNGTLALNADGSFTYTPNANFNGGDSFTYHANDGTADGNIVTVTITVNAVNDAPVAVDDGYNTPEDTPLTVNAVLGVLANDTDAEGTALTAALDTSTTNGTLAFNADGSFTYTPALDFTGTDTFTYHANDGTTDSAIPAIVTLTVGAINDIPVAVADTYTTPEDTPLVIAALLGVLANDTDIDADPLTAIVDTYPTNGTLALNADGSFTYTPNANFNGTDTFTYSANDGTSNSVLPATVTLTIDAVNDAPAVVDDTYNTLENTPLDIATPGVLANDTDAEGDPFTATLDTNPTNGTLTFNADGSFTYTPAAAFIGVDTFTYTATDGTNTSVIATVTILVGVVNGDLIATDDSAGVGINQSIAIDVLANDIDLDGDPLHISAVGQPSSGQAAAENGQIVYTPNAGFVGSDAFTYTAADDFGGEDTAVVFVTVWELVPLCADFDGSTNEIVRADVPGGTVTNGSVFCRILVENSISIRESAEVGKPEVLSQGVIQAVDVFGLYHDGSSTAIFNNPISVCLQGNGAFLYLDATTAPRTVVSLPVFMQNGYTCVLLPNAGTVVLVNGTPSSINPPPETSAPAGPTIPLSDCKVTTRNILNLREQPSASGTLIRMIPYDVALTALERSGGWFYVDYLGERGWISAQYVTPGSNCGQ